jgi:hypothetical protein
MLGRSMGMTSKEIYKEDHLSLGKKKSSHVKN